MSISNLITRLEGMTGPDRNADAMIHHAINDGVGTGCWSDAPHYTSSLDAAMSLVPEGMSACATKYADGSGAAETWRYVTERFPEIYGGSHQNVGARTPAIALCIASLRARMSCDAIQEPAQ